MSRGYVKSGWSRKSEVIPLIERNGGYMELHDIYRQTGLSIGECKSHLNYLVRKRKLYRVGETGYSTTLHIRGKLYENQCNG